MIGCLLRRSHPARWRSVWSNPSGLSWRGGSTYCPVWLGSASGVDCLFPLAPYEGENDGDCDEALSEHQLQSQFVELPGHHADAFLAARALNALLLA